MSVQSDQGPTRSPVTERPPRNKRTLWLVVAAVTAFLLVVVFALVLRWGDTDDDTGRGTGTGTGGSRVVSGQRDGRTQASFVLLDGTKSVTLRTVDLGDRLYRVETAEGAARVPQATVVGDEVKLGFSDSGQEGVSAVDIQLSSAVRWQLRILAGTTEQVLDLTGGDIAGVELIGGATRIALTLPPPKGTTTVRMSGGVAQWTVRQLGDAPVRVKAGSGAASVSIDGTQRNGVAAGTVFTPPTWDTAKDRVDLDAVAGFSTLVVDHG